MGLQTFFDNFALLTDAPNGVTKMRNLVLQLAFKGKLLPQSSLDEPAADLVKRAKAEKARKESQTRINRQELQTGSVDDVALPKNWTQVALGEVTNIIRGITFPGADKSKRAAAGTVACLRTTNVQDVIEWDDLIYIPDKYVKNEEQWVQPNDILISMANSYELVGKVAQVKDIPIRATFGGFLAAIRTFGIDQTYLIYLLRSPVIQLAFRNSSSQTTNIANISMSGIRPLPIPIAPLEEQKRIVAKVDELMRLCNELEARQQATRGARVRLNNAALAPLNNAASLAPKEFEQASARLADNFDALYDSAETVGKLRSTILQLAVQGKLASQNPNDEPASALLEKITSAKTRLSKEKKIRQPELILSDEEIEAPFQLPDGWLWARFGDVTINRDGERIPIEKSIRQGRQGIYDYYGASGVIDKIDDYLFDKPLLLIGEDGANLINRATPIAFIAKGKYWVNNHAHVLDSLSLACLEYLEVFINAIDLRPYITGTAQPKMNQAKMNSILVALAPEEEQKRIVAKVNQLMALCDELETKLRQTEADSEKLMKAAVRDLLASIAGKEKSQRENALALSSV